MLADLQGQYGFAPSPDDNASPEQAVEDLDILNALTAEQEHELFVKFRETGDTALRNELVVKNLGLVFKCCGHYVMPGIEKEDLVQVGNIALIKAVTGFNPEYGVRFSTYAVAAIRQEMQNYVNDVKGPWRMPRSFRSLLYEYQQYRDKWKTEHDTLAEPSEAEVLRNTGVTRNLYRDVVWYSSMSCISIDAPRSDDEDSGTMGEAIPDPSTIDFERRIVNGDLRTALIDAILSLKRLSDTQKTIVLRYFGLIGDGHDNLRTLAAEYHITHQRVQQIVSKALMLLRTIHRELGEYM